MQIATFIIPIKQSAEALEEANRFLRAHSILCTDRRFVENGENSFWSLAVEYLEGAQVAGGRPRAAASRIDYKEVLSPEDFAVFSRLRELRKQIAAADAVPVFTIFTNEQLAKLVTEKVDSKGAMRKIKGIGAATIDKYAERVLAALEEMKGNTAAE